MAAKAKKPAPKKATTRPRTVASAAPAERSKEAPKKPAFGKAAPRKVEPAAKTPAATTKPVSGSARKSGEPSLATKIVHVAAGAVVATAKGAASLVTGKRAGKTK
jgi:hypothetical protein